MIHDTADTRLTLVIARTRPCVSPFYVQYWGPSDGLDVRGLSGAVRCPRSARYAAVQRHGIGTAGEDADVTKSTAAASGLDRCTAASHSKP